MGMKARPIASKVVKARPAPPGGRRARPDPRRFEQVAAELFLPLTQGERANAQRLVTEDARLSAMAKVARYKLVAIEPLVVKPPHPRSGRRLARVVIFDYAADLRVDANVDLEAEEVWHVASSTSQPMLSVSEEAEAIEIACADQSVGARLALGDEVQAVMQYWSRKRADLAYRRRSAIVLFGKAGARPSWVVVVNLVDRVVADVVAAEQW
jgi:hypothetical protein